jgi:NADP-dependent 3-hydroxy acid dehydrogenase YdfG
MAGLQGQVAWVTGAGTGIGLGGAVELAAAGAFVVLSGRRREPLEEAAARIEAAGGKAEVEPLDVGDRGAVERTGTAIVARHGAVDILVNSAGLNVPNRFWKNVTTADWDKVVDINLNGTLYCTIAVLPAMRAKRSGLVINISSWAGRYDTYMTGPAYNASKHGVVALTASLNMEEGANGIRGCVICPGEVATPIMKNRPVPPSAEDMARMLQIEDLGKTIRFVAELPPHACINEIVISPTWNRIYLGGSDLARR